MTARHTARHLGAAGIPVARLTAAHRPAASLPTVAMVLPSAFVPVPQVTR